MPGYRGSVRPQISRKRQLRCARVQPDRQPQLARSQRCTSAIRLAAALSISRKTVSERFFAVEQVPNGRMRVQDGRHQETSRGKLPHISRRAWAMSSSVMSMLRSLPKAAQTAKWFLCAILFSEGIHKLQNFLLSFGRQFAQFLEDLFFYGHAKPFTPSRRIITPLIGFRSAADQGFILAPAAPRPPCACLARARFRE